MAEERAQQEPDLAPRALVPSKRVLSWAGVAVAGAAQLPSLASPWALLQPLRAPPACPPGQAHFAAAPQPLVEASARRMAGAQHKAAVLTTSVQACHKQPKRMNSQLTCDSSCRKPRTLA